jgi:uncharacterized repeat protein (TIGR03803 family)
MPRSIHSISFKELSIGFLSGGTIVPWTVFKIDAGGTLTTLHSFDYSDGDDPVGGLVQVSGGTFYGTTGGGGSSSGCDGGCGTVFKITSAGELTTLYTFDDTDGSGPNALVQATGGNFYGITQSGADNAGTVFRITPDRTLTTLYTLEIAPP